MENLSWENADLGISFSVAYGRITVFMENLSWENADLGISFSVAYGRITVFKTTLKAIGIPPYFRFLLDPENGKLAVEKGC